MNCSSSSLPQYRGLESQQHQDKDWLCCSTSSTTPIHVKNEENEQENTHQQTHQGEGNNNINNNNNNYGMFIEREHMFDKVVTPSDVGKLNRLVIPKQHAEKYFPLDSTNNHKAGILLNFQDLSGKMWRFRYSYWNSSQSYVMTKGWSRFVKEKKLNAGDIVSFQRGVGDELSKSKFFIDWRRRPPNQYYDHHHHHLHFGTAYPVHSSIPTVASWTVLRSSHPYDHRHPHPHLNYPWRGTIAPTYWDHPSTSTSTTQLAHMNMSMMNMVPSYNAVYGSSSTSASVVDNPSLIFLRSSMISPSINPPTPNLPSHIIPSCSSSNFNHPDCVNDQLKVYNSVPVIQGKAPSGATKRSLRLFGVNMDCSPISNEGEQVEHNSSYHDQQQYITAASIDSRGTIDNGGC